MKNVVVVGSASCDFVTRVPRRPQKGETIIGSSFNVFVGGKGNNQALAAARAGASVVMVGRIGSDHFGDTVAQKLAEAGVNIDFLIRDSEVGTGIADILVDEEGDNSIVIAPQANSRLCPEDVRAASAAIKNAAVVLLQLEIPLETAIAAASLGRQSGAMVVLNPAPAPPDGKIPAQLLANVDVIIPNQPEAELLTGHAVRDLAGAVDAGRALQQLGVKNVVLTMGELGAMLLDGNIPLMTPAFQVEVVDTTAAGDAFCGALVAAVASGKNLNDSIVWGCAGGALACRRLGAEPSLPMRAELESLVASRQTCSSCG